jgi:hypothetical protein
MASTPKPKPTMRQKERATSEVKQNSPYWIDGFHFKVTWRDRRIRYLLEQRRPFCDANDNIRVVVQSNIAGLFAMLNFYIPFSDVEGFVKYVAEDFGWGSQSTICQTVIHWTVQARVEYLKGVKEAQHVPPHSSDLAKKICELVDRWRLASRQYKPMTDSRRDQMKTLREQWQRDFRHKPRLLIKTTPEQSANIDPSRADQKLAVEASNDPTYDASQPAQDFTSLHSEAQYWMVPPANGKQKSYSGECSTTTLTAPYLLYPG